MPTTTRTSAFIKPALLSKSISTIPTIYSHTRVHFCNHFTLAHTRLPSQLFSRPHSRDHIRNHFHVHTYTSTHASIFIIFTSVDTHTLTHEHLSLLSFSRHMYASILAIIFTLASTFAIILTFTLTHVYVHFCGSFSRVHICVYLRNHFTYTHMSHTYASTFAIISTSAFAQLAIGSTVTFTRFAIIFTFAFARFAIILTCSFAMAARGRSPDAARERRDAWNKSNWMHNTIDLILNTRKGRDKGDQ